MNKVNYLNDVVYRDEAEQLISNLPSITIQEYTSFTMMKKHSVLERINMQAVKNALSGTEDYILEYFVLYDKIIDLIKELIITRCWKSKIYPLIKKEISEISNVKTYVCLYHEAILVNLLENFFFHLTACQASGDYMIEVVEYCYQRISKLLTDAESGLSKKPKPESNTNLSEVEEMDQRFQELELPIAMSCISIVRYVTDHLNNLPFPVRHHLINVKDILLIIVPILDLKPWIKKGEKEGEELIFEANRWVLKDGKSAKLPKIEAQIWITIHNLFICNDNSKKYEINEFRKRNLLRLKKFMNEVLFDQIPPLRDLFRSLEELSIMSVNSALTMNPFVVEMVADLSRNLEKLNFKEIGLTQLNNHFKLANVKDEYNILSEAYNLNNIEYFMDDPLCGSCGKPATKRCSRCKSEWYCSKECQVQRWKQHKEFCSKMSEINKENEENDKSGRVKIIEKSQNQRTEKSALPEKIIEETKVKIEEIKQKSENTNENQESQNSKVKKIDFDEVD